MTLSEKYEKLKSFLRDLGSAAVAYSSGVDSTFLLKVAHDVLKENVIAVTAVSAIFPQDESNEAEAFCKKEGIRHITFDFDAMSTEGFRQNPKDRCYICKKALFTHILETAHKNNINYVAEGSNKDDDNDYRPGMKAIAELGIVSPLRYAGLEKKEIRELSEKLGLHTAAKPSFACLASRFAYGEEITEEKLAMVEKAEKFLSSAGFAQYRVRIHGRIARIELPDKDIEKAVFLRQKIVTELESCGFTYVTLDLRGYRQGSMNEVL